jgi:hypothetical protein
METTNEDWVNNECGDFMWDEALKSADTKIGILNELEKNNLAGDTHGRLTENVKKN